MKTRSLRIVFAVALLVTALAAKAQHYVPTEPSNKNVIYEEFTGVRCPNCPAGHTVMSQILAAYPDQAFCVAYHPFNSSYTQPYTGDPDFRRHYADSLYLTPWCGTSRYMPSAFVHRRLWSPPERLTERTNWGSYGNTILGESSPLNVGMATAYDNVTHLLSVVVDVYYTAGVTGSHNLMVTLAENNLQSQQSGATGTYTHKHTFREAFVGQWGDPLSDNAQAGTYYRKVFTFDNSTANYIMDNCELLAFVLDNASDEVVSGIGCAVGDTTYIQPDLTLTADTLFYNTAQQCVDGQTVTVKNNSSVPINLTDVQPASLVPSAIMWVVDPWPFTTFPYTLNPGETVDLTIKVVLPLYSSLSGFYLDSLYIISDAGTRYVMIAVDQDLYTSTGDPGASPVCPVLSGNFPNPCTSETEVRFFLPESMDVRLEVIDLAGHPVTTLHSGRLEAGNHPVAWDCTNSSGRPVSPGIILFRLTTPQGVFITRGTLIR